MIRNPAVAAKQIASISHYTAGRISVNVVSGWFKQEFTSIGQWWLEHAERYRFVVSPRFSSSMRELANRVKLKAFERIHPVLERDLD
jgi:hypothetical protein